jgi:hypothetical protein
MEDTIMGLLVLAIVGIILATGGAFGYMAYWDVREKRQCVAMNIPLAQCGKYQKIEAGVEVK